MSLIESYNASEPKPIHRTKWRETDFKKRRDVKAYHCSCGRTFSEKEVSVDIQVEIKN